MNAARLLTASLCCCSVLTALGSTAPAYGQEIQRAQRPARAAASPTLFRGGFELARRARYSEACHKFAASRQLENTLEVARAEKLARKAAHAREPELARLTVNTLGARVPELRFLRNGVAVPPELLGQPMPVSSEEHISEVTAPGQRPWSTRIALLAASSRSVTVPSRQDDTSRTPEAASNGTSVATRTDQSGPPAEGSSSVSWNAGKTLAAIAGTIGLAGTTWSVVQGITFHNKKAEHERLQETVSRCGNRDDPCEVGSARYQDAAKAYAQSRVVREDASRALYRSVAGAMIGGSGFLAGAMLWFTVGQQDSGRRAAVRVQPLASSRLTGISVSGSW